MTKEPTTQAASSEANAAQKPTANTSNSDCAIWPLSSDERAAISERLATLMKRFMKREAELKREPIALDVMIEPADAGSAGAAGNLSESRPSRRPTGYPPALRTSEQAPEPGNDGFGYSDAGEKRIIMPRPSRAGRGKGRDGADGAGRL